jgi:glycosidase
MLNFFSRAALLPSLLLLAACASAPIDTASKTETHGPIIFAESSAGLDLSSADLWLHFDADGAWTGLALSGAADNFIARSTPLTALDFRIDDQWMVEKHGATLLRHAFVKNADGSAMLRMTYGVAPRPPFSMIPQRWKNRAPAPAAMYAPPANFEFELTANYTLRPGLRRVERSAILVRNLSKDILKSTFRHMDGFLFITPGAVVGDPADCVVDVPGPLYTYAYIDPATPYNTLAKTFLDCKTSPDRLPGIVGVTNPKQKLTLATWLDTKAEVSFQTYLSGDGKRVTILQHDIRSERLGDNDTVNSDEQRIEIAPSMRAAQELHRGVMARSMPLSADTPAWAREMVILEVLPAYFKDFKGVAARLPFYRDIGFNALYLMPHWVGSYSNTDPLTLDPKFGSEADLKALVDEAHRLGMHVLFDMVIHGFSKDSPLIKTHDDYFTHDESGRAVTHFNWGTMNTDPASPGYQKYMMDLVKHDVTKYGNDGYRVDANSYKSPNWDPRVPYKPWASTNTLPLYRKMWEAMHEVKPEVILYSEMFGPAWHSVSNLAQDANWAVVQDVLGRWEKGEIDAAKYKAGMALMQDSMPPGANRIRFCRNHDTSWFFPQFFHGYTPRFLALDAVHALFGVPVVFAGDPEHLPSPDTDPATWQHYKRVFAVRQSLPEFASGEVLLREVDCDNPAVFSGLRRLGGDTSLALVNLSDKPQPVALQFHLEGYSLDVQELIDAKDGSRVAIAHGSVTVRPFQVLTGRLRH